MPASLSADAGVLLPLVESVCMLLSMTGHGDAAGQNDRLSVSAEIRSVNNRHLKITVRCPDPFLALEAQIDRLVRETISRGTLTIQLRIRSLGDLSAYHINQSVIRQYWSQLKELEPVTGLAAPRDLGAFLELPGVVDEGEARSVEESDWPFLAEILQTALASLNDFRSKEGEVMSTELLSLCQTIEDHAGEIASRAPIVVRDYRDRLQARLQELLPESVSFDETSLMREFSVFADRCDITEELTRLRSHLQQYRMLVHAPGSQGRKLDFLGQELFREVNTIGSKANDVAISHRVVEMKAAVEKMREIIQNVE